MGTGLAKCSIGRAGRSARLLPLDPNIPAMRGELAIRFVLGGAVVAAFAVLGDCLTPKRFAGIFAAAPSVALASLALAYLNKGSGYTALEGRSMIAGALALMAYAALVSRLLTVRKWHPVVASATAWLVWLGIAYGIWAGVLR
jgi:Protein of unknown function (DUF3147)